MVENACVVFRVFTPVRLVGKGFWTTTRLVMAARSPTGILRGTCDENEALHRGEMPGHSKPMLHGEDMPSLKLNPSAPASVY